MISPIHLCPFIILLPARFIIRTYSKFLKDHRSSSFVIWFHPRSNKRNSCPPLYTSTLTFPSHLCWYGQCCCAWHGVKLIWVGSSDHWCYWCDCGWCWWTIADCTSDDPSKTILPSTGYEIYSISSDFMTNGGWFGLCGKAATPVGTHECMIDTMIFPGCSGQSIVVWMEALNSYFDWVLPHRCIKSFGTCTANNWWVFIWSFYTWLFLN